MRKLLARAVPTKESLVALVAAVILASAAGFALGRLSAPEAEAHATGAQASSPGALRPALQAETTGRCRAASGPFGKATRRGKVTRVIDGDTLVVWRGRGEERVRLLCIDAPERGEPGYAEARRALGRLAEGREVELEPERPGVEKRDRYGRLLAYVVADGVNLNVEMVRLGRARFLTKYGAGRLAGAFRRAEAEARAAGRGSWSSR